MMFSNQGSGGFYNNRKLTNQGLNRNGRRNNIQQRSNHFSNPTRISTVATKSAGNVSKTLTNVQQVLKVVQSATPMVQEYGPMVKNLPAMYRMVKAFQDVENNEDDESTNNLKVIKSDKREKKQAERSVITEKVEQKDSNISIPKLYI